MIYKKTLTPSETKFEYILYTTKETGNGAQANYQLTKGKLQSKGILQYCKENGIVKRANVESDAGPVYEVNDEYQIFFGENLERRITEESRRERPKLYFIKSTSNDKDILQRKLYKKLSDKGYTGVKWFNEAYEKNVQGDIFIIEFDVSLKRIIIEIEVNEGRANIEPEDLSQYIKNWEYENLKEKKSTLVQKVVYGPPGNGKSYNITKEICEVYPNYREEGSPNVYRITIFDDYSYHDFIGSIQPKVKTNGDEKTISYDFNPGPFTLALKRAFEKSNEQIYLIIEEMSRGNITSIFGDVFQLLDRNAFGESEYGINNSLISTYIYDKVDKEVKLPKNFNIIGTFNTSDQSVFALDSAFKRRFNFEYIGINPIKNGNKEYKNNFYFFLKDGEEVIHISWIEFYQHFNNYITEKMNVSEDKQIGQFFINFDNMEESEAYQQIYNKLLQYIWSDIISLNRYSHNLIRAEYNTFSKAYIALKEKKNIFSEDFISLFNLKEKDDTNEYDSSK